MNKMKRFSQLFSTALVSFLLTSCGGGGGSQVAEGGIGGTGVTAGRVSGFGSVFVNGIEYETNGTEFTINGASGSESDLAIGMVVNLTGSKDETTSSGSADSIDYSSLVTGPVDIAYNATNDTFGAMGQLISVNADTVYEGSAARATVDTLTLNDIVEISGFSDGSSGTILATRIEVKTTTPSTYEVVGEVVWGGIGTSFTVGTLTIEAGTLTIPAQGTLVEVESSTPPSGNTLTADSIEPFGNGDGTVGDDGEEVEVEGLVTVDFNSTTNRFTLNGQVVEVDISTTEFKEGATTADLVTGRIIEVEGTMSGDILLAEEIEAEADESSKEEMGGNVTAVVVGSGGAGSITLLGQTVLVTNSTILKSDLGTEESFNLTELQTDVEDFYDTNDYVEVNVFRDGNGDLVASKIERDELPGSDPTYAELEGIASFVGGVLSVLDVNINYTTYPYSDGDRIEVTGTFSGGTLYATSISPAD
jgi:hypothetical protein